MNYPPPTSPTPASARNRRSGRVSAAPSGRRPRQSRRKKTAKKIRFPLTWWQLLILLALALGILWGKLSCDQAQEKLLALQQERQESLERYQKEVASYQVKYRDWITYYAAVNRIDPAYVAAIIKRESDYDPRAVSRKDARGLMQMMPDTFDWVRKNTGYRNAEIDILYEPEAAIKMGCYLLRYICDTLKTDDPILVACAYHAGWGNVNTWLQKYSTDGKHLTLAQIPAEDTRYYAGKVLNAYAIYQQYYY